MMTPEERQAASNYLKQSRPISCDQCDPEVGVVCEVCWAEEMLRKALADLAKQERLLREMDRFQWGVYLRDELVAAFISEKSANYCSSFDERTEVRPLKPPAVSEPHVTTTS